MAWIRAPSPLLLQQRGIETVVQITSRDRNRIAVPVRPVRRRRAGLRNFVFMGGDSTASGDHPEAKPVFDLTASGLLGRRRSLAAMAGITPANPLTGTPDLFLGATCNPGAERFAAEIEKYATQDRRGARLLQTQAIFHVEPLQRFVDALKPDGVAILAGVIPLKSEKTRCIGSTSIYRGSQFRPT
jgi:5,10-methylenetetrahydrofolate reductase